MPPGSGICSPPARAADGRRRRCGTRPLDTPDRAPAPESSTWTRTRTPSAVLRHRGRHRRRGVDDEQVPGAKQFRQLAKRACSIIPSRAMRDKQPHSRRARAPRRLACLERGRQLERERGHALAPRELARPVAAARELALDQREQPGHAFLGLRPVGDVLVRERLLMHPGPHVAGIDRVDAELRVLGLRGSPSAARARPSTSRSRPTPRTARPPASEVTLTIRRRRRRSAAGRAGSARVARTR